MDCDYGQFGLGGRRGGVVAPVVHRDAADDDRAIMYLQGVGAQVGRQLVAGPRGEWWRDGDGGRREKKEEEKGRGQGILWLHGAMWLIELLEGRFTLTSKHRLSLHHQMLICG